MDIRKRNKWSDGKRKNRILKRRNRHRLTVSDLSIISKQSDGHIALSHIVTLSRLFTCNFDIEANNFYDRAHRLYDAAILIALVLQLGVYVKDLNTGFLHR